MAGESEEYDKEKICRILIDTILQRDSENWNDHEQKQTTTETVNVNGIMNYRTRVTRSDAVCTCAYSW